MFNSVFFSSLYVFRALKFFSSIRTGKVKQGAFYNKTLSTKISHIQERSISTGEPFRTCLEKHLCIFIRVFHDRLAWSYVISDFFQNFYRAYLFNISMESGENVWLHYFGWPLWKPLIHLEDRTTNNLIMSVDTRNSPCIHLMKIILSYIQCPA